MLYNIRIKYVQLCPIEIFNSMIYENIPPGYTVPFSIDVSLLIRNIILIYGAPIVATINHYEEGGPNFVTFRSNQHFFFQGTKLGLSEERLANCSEPLPFACSKHVFAH